MNPPNPWFRQKKAAKLTPRRLYMNKLLTTYTSYAAATLGVLMPAGFNALS